MRYPLVIVSCLVTFAAGCGVRQDDEAGPARQDSTSAIAPEPSQAATDSSSVEAAARVVHEYYDAIAARDYKHAYSLWDHDGAASGKTYEAFAAGFEDTEGVSVQVGPPGTIEGAAGSRYVDIPVDVLARTTQGALQRYAGTYALRRSEVDGATPAQRRWHLYSASIQER